VGFGMIFKQIDADNFESFLLMDGSLTFQEAATTDGAPVIGTIEANIRESGW
jgi:hypothetical protein